MGLVLTVVSILLIHITPFYLILFQIECCIDKWASGTWSPIKFTVNDYESLYHLHVANLNEFEDYMKEFIMLPKMIRVLHNNGQCVAYSFILYALLTVAVSKIAFMPGPIQLRT